MKVGRRKKLPSQRRSKTIVTWVTPGEHRVVAEAAREGGFRSNSDFTINVLRRHLALAKYSEIATLAEALDSLERANALTRKLAMEAEHREKEIEILERMLDRAADRLKDAEFTAALRKQMRVAPGPDAGRLSEEVKDGTAKTPA